MKYNSKHFLKLPRKCTGRKFPDTDQTLLQFKSRNTQEFVNRNSRLIRTRINPLKHENLLFLKRTVPFGPLCENITPYEKTTENTGITSLVSLVWTKYRKQSLCLPYSHTKVDFGWDFRGRRGTLFARYAFCRSTHRY